MTIQSLNSVHIASPPDTRELNILLVEDSETDAYTVQRILGAYMPCACNIIHVTTIYEAENVLSSRNDLHVVLLDLGLPDSSGGADAYERLEVFKERVPIIVLTSVEDHNLAMSVVGIGAQDYVYKDSVSKQPENLCRTIQFAIGRHHSLKESRKNMVHALEQQEELLHLVTGSYSYWQGNQ